MHPFRTTLSVTAIVFTLAAPARADVVAAGRWEGAIEIPGQKLAVVVVLSGEGAALKGDISIPAQGAKNLALEKLSQNGAEVTFAIKGVPGDPTFKGKLAADGASMSGDFMQGGVSFPFKLERKQPPAEAAKVSMEGFDAWVDQAREAWNVPGVAVGIIRDGKVVYAKGSGVRDLDGKQPVTTRTLFAIGSSTKAFTTFLMGALADDGKLDLDKPVTDYMPSFKLHDSVAAGHITGRDLVTHRSGLPRHDMLWYNSTMTREEMVSRLKYLEPNEEFRSRWQYNNLMFLTAGYLCEKITGKTWEEGVKSRIFEPLGMKRSNFSVKESQASDDFACPYEKRDDKMRKMPFRDISNVGPAGSINSCVDDMMAWVRLHLEDGKWNDKQIITPARLADLHTPQMVMGGEVSKDGVVGAGYAMGWFVDVYRGHLRVHHGGNIDGFSALVCLLPDDNTGLVILCNMNGSALPGLINRHAIDRMFKLEPRDWNAEALAKREIAEKGVKEAEKKKEMARRPGTNPAHVLSEYAGEYEHPGYGVVAVSLSGDKLGIAYNRITAPLSHWHFETFVAGKNEADPALEGTKVLFRTGEDGEIESLEVSVEPSVKPASFARKPDAILRDPAYLKKFVGEYLLDPETVVFSLSASTLSATLKGQPTYELVPTRNNSFALKGLTGFSVKFTLNADGSVKDANFIQPNGVFTATPKK